jgi:hypothetical protein
MMQITIGVNEADVLAGMRYFQDHIAERPDRQRMKRITVAFPTLFSLTFRLVLFFRLYLLSRRVLCRQWARHEIHNQEG